MMKGQRMFLLRIVVTLCARTHFRSLPRAVLSCFGKKVPKEAAPGEALTAKPFGTASVALAGQPDFEPPSPGYPSRPPSVTGQESNMGSVAVRNVVSGSLSLRCGVYRQQLSLRAVKRRGNPQRRHSQDAIAGRAISSTNRNLRFL